MEACFTALKESCVPQCTDCSWHVTPWSLFLKLRSLYIFFLLTEEHKALRFLKHLRGLNEVIKGIYCLPRNKEWTTENNRWRITLSQDRKLWIEQVTCNPSHFALIITWCHCSEPASQVFPTNLHAVHNLSFKANYKLNFIKTTWF